MKTVLCYGDSNTFGSATVPTPDGRYGPNERWTGVLQTNLGQDWRVIEEGLGGRTTVSDDLEEGAFRNGRTYLTPCLLSHRPLDLVIIMLGTNDLKVQFNKSAAEIAQGVATLIGDIRGLDPAVGREGSVPAILIISPPPTRDEFPEHAEKFEGAHAKSQQMATEYAKVAQQENVSFFDAGSVIESSIVDGFHFDPDAHLALGRAIADVVKRL